MTPCSRRQPWALLVLLILCIAATCTGEAISEDALVDTEMHPDLRSVKLSEIVQRKDNLVAQLQTQRDSLRDSPKLTAAEKLKESERLETRSGIQQLSALEDIASNSLEILRTAVSDLDSFNTGETFKNESLKLINRFQRLVLKTKTDIDKIEQSEKTKGKQLKGAPDSQKVDESTLGEKSIAKDIVDDVMSNVAVNADRLESDMKENGAFEEGQKAKGSTLETVVKMKDTEEEEDEPGLSKENVTKSDFPKISKPAGEKKAAVLIDSENNHYVLTKANDITVMYEDARLLKDIMWLLLACFGCTYVMYLLRLPTFFGHILAGILLGPSGAIKNVIQVETIARGLGILFMFFHLGLEFNYSKIRKVWKVSLLGGTLILIITVCSFVVVGMYLQAGMKEAIVIGASVFLSSTAVVLKFLGPHDAETSYGRPIMGILVMQDVMLGVLLAVMPALEKSGSEVINAITRISGSLAIFLLVAVLAMYPIRLILGNLKVHGGRELFLLGSVGVCLTMIQLTSLLGLSMELSCFVAGVVISAQKSHGEKALHTIEPLRDLFASLFFASIGLHIYPSFLLNEGQLLLMLTLGAMLFKIVTTLGVMMLVFRKDFNTAATIGVGLGQVSEYAFVFAARAKSAGVITREIYYLLLGVTALSLLISPLLWRLVTMAGSKKGLVDGGMSATLSGSSPARRTEGLKGQKEDEERTLLPQHSVPEKDADADYKNS
ncbi:Transmembrane and coiled-coil domains-containing protein 3 [Borealophlyctis nickersoniae]|nr:Transmembrane and coiled-coil domains-containing protein 3 [Borealophlyctis nickersoniae]